MDTRLLILVLLAAVFIWGLILAMKRPKFKPNCVKCESENVVEVDRRTVATRTVETSGGGMPGGGSVRLQIDSELTLHCKACGQSFKKTVTETH